MNKFGLIGDPISKSLSPALFEAGYGGKYSYDLIEGSDFGASFKAFEDRYKGSMLLLLSRRTRSAELISTLLIVRKSAQVIFW